MFLPASLVGWRAGDSIHVTLFTERWQLFIYMCSFRRVHHADTNIWSIFCFYLFLKGCQNSALTTNLKTPAIETIKGEAWRTSIFSEGLSLLILVYVATASSYNVGFQLLRHIVMSFPYSRAKDVYDIWSEWNLGQHNSICKLLVLTLRSL